MVSLVLAAVAYGGWYALSERDKVAVETVPEVPATMLAEATDGEPRPAADARVAVAATVDDPAAATTPTPAASVDPADSAAAPPPPAAQPAPADDASSPAEPPAPDEAAQVATTATVPLPPPAPTVPEAAPQPAGFAPQGQVYGVDNKDARIVILARLESWVRVSDKNQKPVWTRVLREGEAYQVPNDPSLTLTTGNAGGLEIYVDGKPIAPIGGVGMVSRNVSLDPAAFAETRVQ
jgi:cytoskeleton protein RodZ